MFLIKKYTREEGFLSYYEICEKISKQGWVKKWDDQQKVPYAYDTATSQWVSFDDRTSLKLKVSHIW